MTVADLGAGTGYFSRHLSAAVGPEGTVLAADTEPNMVAHLRERAEAERTVNVVPILASADNPRLPAHADRKSTRLNSSHLVISYAVFCLKKKKKTDTPRALTYAASVLLCPF